MKKLAVMQPYFFPYIGYFQLISVVDTFVFYDDVQYIKGGWINRNRILIKDAARFFTVSCIKGSPNKKINEIEFDPDRKENKNLIKTIEQCYKKALYFDHVYPMIEKILATPTNKLSVLAIQSIIQVSNYLRLRVNFKTSSKEFGEIEAADRTGRLIEICKREAADKYINAIGGIDIYQKEDFRQHGIDLKFIKTNPEIRYVQGGKTNFIPGLSVIDVLMNNSIEEIHLILKQHSFQ